MATSTFHPTLYTPAITPQDKQLTLLNNDRPSEEVRRIVLCTEDSIGEHQVDQAIETLRDVLDEVRRDTGVTAYVRVRNPEVMRRVLELPAAHKLRGFVVPKADPQTLQDYANQIIGSEFTLMPILESSKMFDRGFREALLRDLMLRSDSIECLRIGVNDLMGFLGIRRAQKRFTVYDTPVGALIKEIINEFRGVGEFTITAPVFECYDEAYDKLLRREVRQHMLNGLYGQTVIHPRHVQIIRDLYRVSEADLDSARAILANGQAVSGLNGRMDEYTTHWKWATMIIERYELFGVKTKQPILEAVAS